MPTQRLPLLALCLLLLLIPWASGCTPSPDSEPEPASGEEQVSSAPTEEAAPVCGPQSPRDITRTAGTNTVPVPDGPTPHLCNVHFHEPVEHAGIGELPSVAEAAGGEPVCESVEVGDRVEFHWVHTNCEPGDEVVQGLDNCVCNREDLVLRVYAQAYVVGEDGVAPEQPEGDLSTYAGSTTGPNYDNETCSPAKVNWEVARAAEVLARDELATWCESNPWPGEDHPHEARELVTREDWLSEI